VQEDADDVLARVTCAWALVRSLRRSGDSALAAEAEALLATTTLADGPIATLLTALRAALAAERGQHAEALTLAERALSQDARQVDALATVAVASAGLGKAAEAERTQRRLRELAPDEAVANDAAILRRRHGRDAPKAPPVPPARWGAEEAALTRGDSLPALELLARKARDALRAQQRRGGTEVWHALAMQAAHLLTELPVFRHFAPYDCSVFSVDRLEAALSLLFGSGSPRTVLDEATVVLLGAYVGESWRQAFGADWHGVLSFPFAASVQGIGLMVRPCERVRERLEQGVALGIETPHSLHPGADPLGNSVPLSLVPPAPWDPAEFPSVAEFSALGRNLGESVIGLYCERTLGLRLDLSISTAVAIDRYVALLAPSKAPPDPNARWARRVALLLGAYLGEILVDAVAASWENIVAPKSLEDYRLVLPHGNAATLAVRVEERLTGRRAGALAEHVARLSSGRNSISV
ncbi:MAG TPA: hypothetical protein VFQ35_12140, partial [Polyangiaceae bacterium]|nr:hypothetical protein [Polyangiaceae bacterium]